MLEYEEEPTDEEILGGPVIPLTVRTAIFLLASECVSLRRHQSRGTTIHLRSGGHVDALEPLGEVQRLFQAATGREIEELC